MENKICNKCKSPKKLTQYGKDLRNKDGLQGICEDCRKIVKQKARQDRLNGKNIVPVSKKKCNSCLKTKPIDGFYRDAGISDGHATICKICREASSQRWRENNREHYNAKMREYNKKNYLRIRLYRYKLTPEKFEELLKSQDGKCKMCGSPPRGKRPLAIDHCHETGKIRGLLCYGCNRILHSFDSTKVFERALSYLERHK